MYKIILILLTLVFLSACSSEKKESLKVAISSWPGYEPLVLGLEKGFYSELDIRIIRFATPTESFRALRDGAVDIAAITADEALQYSQVKNKPKMFLVLDISNGSDAIVASKNINSLDDLKGKKVCVEPSALGDYMIHRAMDFTNGLKVEDFEIIPVDVGNHVEIYKKGEVDAIVTYEPFRSQLIKEGAHVIFDSKKMPNEIIDVLVTHENILSSKKDTIKKLVDGWFRTVEYIKNNKKESMQRMASYEFISAEEFKKAYDALIIPSRKENLEMLGSSEKSYSKVLNKLSLLMYEKGTINKHEDRTDSISDSVIKSSN